MIYIIKCNRTIFSARMPFTKTVTFQYSRNDYFKSGRGPVSGARSIPSAESVDDRHVLACVERKRASKEEHGRGKPDLKRGAADLCYPYPFFLCVYLAIVPVGVDSFSLL